MILSGPYSTCFSGRLGCCAYYCIYWISLSYG